MQKEIPLVSKMPDRPEPLKVRDWKQTARAYDGLVFDFSQEGPFLPLISWDLGQVNFQQKSFFLRMWAITGPSLVVKKQSTLWPQL